VTSRRGLDAAFAAGVGIGLLVVLLSGFVALREQRVASNDWSGIWAGPRTLVLGGDPYDPTTWAADAIREQEQSPMTPVYGYPGHVLLALVPLGALPLGPAAFIWGAAGIAFAILGVRALLHAYVPALPVIHTLAGFTLIASQPAVLTLHNGQWGFLLVGLISLSVLGLRGGHDLRAGGALALAALAKPQLFLISVPTLLRVALARGRPRALLAFAGVAVALVAVSIAVMPRWPGEWVHVVTGRLPLRPQATAVPTAFADLFGPAGLALGALLIVALAVAVVAFHPRSDAAIAVALAVSAVVVPYAWSYDQLLLVVPLVIAAGLVARRSPPRGVALMCAGSVLLLLVGTLLHTLFGEARQSESYNAVVPALMALLIVVGLWPLRGHAGTGSPPPP
jgi:hypothetical protein